MAANTIPDPPAQLKAIQSYMKIAADIERIDPVVSYWVRLYSTETALSIDKDSPDSKTFLSSIILWLEQFKQSHKDNEAVSNQTVGQAHMENFVVALFTKADTLDRNGTANKNTVRMFYMAAVLFEAMAVFGTLDEEITKRAKYAKFKAAYIQKCLKLGQVPKPGPIEGSDLEDPSYSATDGTAEDPNASKLLSHDENSEQKNSDTIINNSDPFIITPKPMPPNFPMPQTYPTPVEPTSKQVAQPANPVNTTSSALGKSTIDSVKFHATNGSPLNAEDMIKAQKFCKFANSALQYDDIPTAVLNLEKALKLLNTGRE